VRLTQPEHGLPADFAIAIGLGDFDQFGNASIFGQLAQRENGFFFTWGSGSFSIVRVIAKISAPFPGYAGAILLIAVPAHLVGRLAAINLFPMCFRVHR
jgi:hypothetical protein